MSEPDFSIPPGERSMPPIEHLRPDRRVTVQWIAALFPPGGGRALAVSDCPFLPAALGGDYQWQVYRPASGEQGGREAGFTLPFEDQCFDAVLLAATGCRDPLAGAREAHRVLRDEGRLVFMVNRRKRWPLAAALRKLLALRPDPEQAYAAGEVFAILKDGFDMEELRQYTRICRYSQKLIFDAVEGWSASSDPLDAWCGARGWWAQSAYTVAGLLDRLLFMAPGYIMAGRARRRSWRPRRTPVLRDGRSIAEAALGSKIGSAGDF